MFKHLKQGAVDVITPDTPINGSTTDHLYNAVNSISGGQPRVVIDLSGVPLVNGAGLEALLDMHETAQQRGGQLRLASPNPLVEDLLRVSEIAALIEVYESTSSAVGSFSK